MKKMSVILVAFMLIGLLGMSAPQRVYAESFALSWSSGYQVLNLDTVNDASIYIYYYNQDGTLADLSSVGLTNPVPDTITKGTAKAYATIHAPAGFNGSVMISSNTPLAVITNLQVNTAAQAVDSYVGVNQGAPKIYFPSIVKGNNGTTTTFNIQNTGSNATTVTIHFTPEVGHVPAYATITDITQAIQPGAAWTFDLGVLSNFTAITKWVGSATATVADLVNDSIAGVASGVNMNNAAAALLNSYNSFSQGSPTVVLPLVSEANSGNRTGITCQNLGTFATDIEIDYIPEAGRPAKVSETKPAIDPMGVAVFLPALAGVPTFTGSAIVKSNAIGGNPVQPLACVVNQQKPSAGKISSYIGLNPASATSKVVLPLFVSKNSNPTNGLQYSSFSVATVDGLSHQVTCKFTAENSSYPAVTDEVLTGSVVIFPPKPNQNNLYGNGAKFVGSATCSTNDGAGIFAIVNTSREPGQYSVRDTLSTYDAFNVAP